eukprot:CFRG1862T1
MVVLKQISTLSLLSILGVSTLVNAMPNGRYTCVYLGNRYDDGERVEGQTLTCTCSNRRWIQCEPNEVAPPAEEESEPDEVEEPEDMTPALVGANVGFNQFINNFENEDFILDFSDQTAVPVGSDGLGGTVQAANINNFPVLQTAEMSQTRFHIGPCGINLPHVHPRGTESIYMVEGELTVGFVTEGGRLIINDVSADQSTFFPQGLLHYQQNMGCEQAGFISILNSADPGLLVIPSALGSLPTEALEATFEEDEVFIEQLRLGLPEGPARGRAECLRRCNLPVNTPMV